MSLGCHAYGKIFTLIHMWESFSSSDVINVKSVLEGIHLQRKVPFIHNKCTILELV